MSFKRTLYPAGIALLLASIAYAEPQTDKNALHIVNPTTSEQVIWINGEEITLAVDSGIRLPCVPSEPWHIEHQEELSVVRCGQMWELSDAE